MELSLEFIFNALTQETCPEKSVQTVFISGTFFRIFIIFRMLQIQGMQSTNTGCTWTPSLMFHLLAFYSKGATVKELTNSTYTIQST